MDKICASCGVLQPLDLFPRHKNMADGHLSKCKSCVNEYVRNRRAMHPEQYAKYFKEYKARPYAAAARRAYQARPEVRRSEMGNKTRWAKANRIKRLAHQAVTRAVRTGRLHKCPCEVCGEKVAQAHHDDYTKPLDVRWLCTKHHAEWHRKNKPICPAQEEAA